MSDEEAAVHIDGISKFQASLDKLKDKQDIAAFKFVVAGAEIINKRAKAVFIGGGEALATDVWRSDAWPIPTRRSGFLQQSIRASTPVRVGLGTWSIVTGPRTVYGRRIELGYTGRGVFPYFTTRPFPFLKPAVEDSKDDLAELYERLVLTAQEE
jgi:hypothetical protein